MNSFQKASPSLANFTSSLTSGDHGAEMITKKLRTETQNYSSNFEASPAHSHSSQDEANQLRYQALAMQLFKNTNPLRRKSDNNNQQSSSDTEANRQGLYESDNSNSFSSPHKTETYSNPEIRINKGIGKRKLNFKVNLKPPREQRERSVSQKTFEQAFRENVNEYLFKARPAPKRDAFKLRPAEKHDLTQKPFALKTEERGSTKQKILTKEKEKIERSFELIKPFKAQEIPNYAELSKLGVNNNFKPLKRTVPVEFQLRTNIRAECHKTNCLKHILEKNDDCRSTCSFRATPAPTNTVPFKPEIGTHSLTEFDKFTLHSQERFQKRSEHEIKMRERKLLKEQQERKAEEERKRKEDKELQDYRKALEFKARPIGYEAGNACSTVTKAKN